jgi:threonine dehydratase
MKLTLKDIQAAAKRLHGEVMVTPCSYSRTLSKITGAEVFLKFENLQFTASFKERGALNKLLSLTPEQHRRGVIAMSAGNHAQGVAFHAKRLGIPAVIVMPIHTPELKVQLTRSHDAEVILQGETFHQASTFAKKLCRQRRLTLVHPYDDLRIMAGQGTIALEMLAQQPELETLIVPVGGGGLLAGMAVAAKAIRPDIELVGVQSDRFPAMTQWFNDEIIECGQYTVAEGIAVKAPGRLTGRIIRDLVNDLLLVGEKELEYAILNLLQIEKTVVEGAGAAGLAALTKFKKRFRRKNVGLILSGGNIDLMALSSIIQRGLVRNGQVARMRVETRDLPGILARVSGIIGRHGGNILEVNHQRAFSAQPLQIVAIDFILQTRGREHFREIEEALRADGAKVLPLQQELAK